MGGTAGGSYPGTVRPQRSDESESRRGGGKKNRRVAQN